MKQLILGGARSGKSRLAESLSAEYGHHIGYIATSDTSHNDREMEARIVHHRRQRPQHWQTLEIPITLGDGLIKYANTFDAIMVDCLTLWLSNCLMASDDTWAQEKQRLIEALGKISTPIILVSNEVGMGIVPMGELSRRFVDEAGFLHQEVARVCERVIFTAAGLPLIMKGDPLTTSTSTYRATP